MNSHLLKIMKIVGLTSVLIISVACQDTIPKRSTIISGSTTDMPECTADQELTTETIDGVEYYVCKDKAAVRPTGAITWKADFCACKDTKAVSYGNCSTICADKNTNGAEILYANFTVNEEISLNNSLKTVYGWCKNVLETDTVNPSCKLQAKDEAGNVSSIDVVVGANANSLTANIQDKLSYDKTYVLTLVEESSGAKSNSIQMIKFSTDTTLPTLGFLKNAQISQYSCIVRALSEDGNYDSAYRLHYYFTPSLRPDPIAAGGNAQLICHDIFTYGVADKATYPRFEELPAIFNLWDTTDPRFYDNNGNGSLDINEAIVQKTKNFGATIPADSKFFIPFTWPGPPTLNSEAGNTTTTSQTMGYYMAPWIDPTTFKSYCLNSTHYNSTNALYKALRDYLGTDTEGLYVGVKAAETITNNDGTTSAGLKDYLLIREADLKSVWFYLNAGVPTAPTDANVANNSVYFYYPLNKTSPYIQTSTQRLYKVTSASELSTSSTTTTTGSTSSGVATNYPPHDRKIGCVPKF